MTGRMALTTVPNGRRRSSPPNTTPSREHGGWLILGWILPAALASSVPRDTNVSSATRGWAAYIPRMPSLPMKSWAKPHWASAWMNNLAGDRRENKRSLRHDMAAPLLKLLAPTAPEVLTSRNAIDTNLSCSLVEV